MSSDTSTDPNTTFRPWHLFALAGLLASTVGVVVSRPDDPVALILLVLAIAAAGGVGLAVYHMLRPLAAQDFKEMTPVIDGRNRARIEREKTLVLRSIKELEFDRAMGKVSDADSEEMGQRLRTQALVLMKQLDFDMPGYREVIERELAQRLGVKSEGKDNPVEPSENFRAVCGGCGTQNETDARFCKGCGSPVEGSA